MTKRSWQFDRYYTSYQNAWLADSMGLRILFPIRVACLIMGVPRNGVRDQLHIESYLFLCVVGGRCMSQQIRVWFLCPPDVVWGLFCVAATSQRIQTMRTHPLVVFPVAPTVQTMVVLLIGDVSPTMHIPSTFRRAAAHLAVILSA